MQLATRPWITAGVVLAGASVIVATSVEAPLPDLPTPAIQLTAGFDPIAEWEQVLQQASANATDIWDHWSPAPFPALQQVLVNQVGYLEEILKNPSTIADIPTQIENNFNAAVNAAITPFTPVNPEPYIYPSVDTTPITIPIHLATLPFVGPVTVSLTLAGKAGLLDILEHGLTVSGPFGLGGTIPVLPLSSATSWQPKFSRCFLSRGHRSAASCGGRSAPCSARHCSSTPTSPRSATRSAAALPISRRRSRTWSTRRPTSPARSSTGTATSTSIRC